MRARSASTFRVPAEFTSHSQCKQFSSRLPQKRSPSRGDSGASLQFYPLTLDSFTAQDPNRTGPEFENSNLCNLLIKEMSSLYGATNDPNWFIKKMIPYIPAKEIQSSLNMLIKTGFIKWEKQNNRFVQTKKDIVAEMPGYLKGVHNGQHTVTGRRAGQCCASGL